jgi:hypothetical protein
MTKLLQRLHTQKRAPANKHKRILATLLCRASGTKKGDKFVRNRVAVFIWEINLIILLNVAWSIWRDLQANHFFILLRDESADSAASAFAGRCLRLCLCRHWLLLRVTTESRFSLSAAPALSTRLLAGLFLRRPKPFHAELVADFCSKQFHSIDSTNSNMQNCLSSDHQVSPSLFSVSYMPI